MVQISVVVAFMTGSVLAAAAAVGFLVAKAFGK